MATGETQSAVYPLLKRTLAACRGGFLAVGLFSLAINLLLLTIPLYMLQLFDRVLTSRSEDTLFALSIAAASATGSTPSLAATCLAAASSTAWSGPAKPRSRACATC